VIMLGNMDFTPYDVIMGDKLIVMVMAMEWVRGKVFAG
jgi:hypothetical protein